MTRHLTILLVLILSAAAVVPLSAHENFRIIGTLERHQNSSITVKKSSGTYVWIKMNNQTEVTQNKKKVGAGALKAGQSLVVDAYGDKEDGSLALEIRIVPPIQRGER